MSPALLRLVVVQVAIVLVAVLRAKGLALLLGPGGMGIVSTLDQLVLTLASVGGFAVPFTALRMMSRAHSDGPDAFRAVGGRFLRAMLALALVATVGCSLAVWLRPALFGADLEAHHVELKLAVVGTFYALVSMFLINAYAAAGRHTAAAMANLATTLALAIAAVAGAASGGLTGLYLATAATGVAVSLGSVLVLTRGLGLRLAAAPGTTSTRAVAGQAASYYAIVVVTAVTMLVARTSMMSQLGDAATGQLQALLSISVTVATALSMAINLLLIPLVNRKAEPAAKVAATDEFLRRVLVLLAPAAVGLALFPTFLLRLLYSPAFASASGMLWMFVLWQCVAQVVAVYQQLLIGLDDLVFCAVAATFAFAGSMAAMSLAIASLGLVGVAVAMGGGTVLYLSALLMRLRLRHQARPSLRVALRVVMVLGLAAAAGVVGQLPTETVAGLVLPRVAVVALLAVWARFGLDPAERNPVAWLRSLPGKAAT